MSRTLTQTARPMFGASAVRGAHSSTLERVLHQFITTLFVWSERMEQRRALAAMDARQLEDLGIDREAALVEARKPFWSA